MKKTEALPYTSIRHAVLTHIAHGHVCCGLRVTGWRIALSHTLPTTYGRAETTVSALVKAGYVRIPLGVDAKTPLVLTELGADTLGRWDTKKPTTREKR